MQSHGKIEITWRISWMKLEDDSCSLSLSHGGSLKGHLKQVFHNHDFFCEWKAEAPLRGLQNLQNNDLYFLQEHHLHLSKRQKWI